MKIYRTVVEEVGWEGTEIKEEYFFDSETENEKCNNHLSLIYEGMELHVTSDEIEVLTIFIRNPRSYWFRGCCIDKELFITGEDNIDQDDVNLISEKIEEEMCNIKEDEKYDTLKIEVKVTASSMKEALEKSNEWAREILMERFLDEEDMEE